MNRRGVAMRGSATVEFVLVVPFLLAIMAVVWDVREQLGFRTDIARQVHIAAEAAAADHLGDSPFAAGMGQLRALLERDGVSGSIDAAVIVRGATRRDASECPADEWCPPVVAATWPASAADGTWAKGTADGCAAPPPNPLPDAGDTFDDDATVLPREAWAANADPDDESTWISRSLGPEQWWVVLDICFEPRGGTFSGRLANLSVALFDAQPVSRRRIAWGSIHDVAICDWCRLSASGTPLFN